MRDPRKYSWFEEQKRDVRFPDQNDSAVRWLACVLVVLIVGLGIVWWRLGR